MKGGSTDKLRKAEARKVIPALAGVLVIFVVLLVPLRVKFDDLWTGGLWNLLHLPGFFFLTRFLSSIFARLRGAAFGHHLAAVLALVAGGGTELLQSRLGRSASVHDFVLDGFGVLLAITWPTRPDRWSTGRGIATALTLFGGIVFALAPALNQEFTIRQARERLPVLGLFEEARLRRLWVPQGATTADWDDGTGGLTVRMKAGAFGGINYQPCGQDWSGYRELAMTCFNPGAPLRLGVRIDDTKSAADRVWHSDETTVETGLSEVRIPLGIGHESPGRRVIDWTGINRLVLFVDKNPNPVEFSLRSAVLR